MPATAVSNILDDRGTVNNIIANRLVIEMDDQVYLLEPDAGPFLTLTSRAAKRVVRATKVEWIESEMLPHIVSSTTADSGTGTTTSVTLAAGFGVYVKPGDLLRVETTGEIVQVATQPSDTITITRAIGQNPGANTANDWGSGTTYFYRMSNASMQGAQMPAIRMTQDVPQFNYTQIQRDPFGVVRSLAQTKTYLGPALDLERKKKFIDHKRQLNSTGFWGRKSIDNTGTHPRMTAQGVVPYMSTNIQNAGGTLTRANLETYLQPMFRYGSSTKFAFCSPRAFSALTGFYWGGGGITYPTLAIDSWAEAAKQVGVPVRQYQTGAGDVLNLVLEREWLGDQGYGLPLTGLRSQTGSMVILDLDYVKFCPFLDTVLYGDGRQLPDEDATKGEYITEFSWQLTHERCHGYIYNITG